MVYHSISADKKRRALQLLNEGYELPQIAHILGVSSKSISCWQDNYDTHGCVDLPSSLRGRHHILSGNVIDELWELIEESPDLFLDKIGSWLALFHVVQISMTALHDNLQDLGLSQKTMHRAAMERDDQL